MAIPLPMNHLDAEVSGRFDTPGDCNSLLYAPSARPLTYRKSRRYRLEFVGDESAARGFVQRVLVDPVSEHVQFGDGPAIPGARFFVDYGMKPGALDLEKEAILKFAGGSRSKAQFELRTLTLRQRLYVFGDGADPAPFVRDIVNPAIHVWSVSDFDRHARTCA